MKGWVNNMYIEKNGYVIMNIEQMSFLDGNTELSDDIEDADIFEEYITAKEISDNLNNDAKECNSSPDIYEVVKYHKTIWLDKSGLTNEKTTFECEGYHCGANCVCGKLDLECHSASNEIEEDINE